MNRSRGVVSTRLRPWAVFSALIVVACGTGSADAPTRTGAGAGGSGSGGAGPGAGATDPDGGADVSQGGSSGGEDDASADGAGAGGGGTGGAAGSAGAAGGADAAGCAFGTADCDGDASNGCEVDTTNDAANCGSCGLACGSGPDGAATCVNGNCVLACAGARRDCNADATDGCETDIDGDPQHCGSCSSVCGTAPCIHGGCECAAVSQAAQTLPLALYMMIDQSGSMADTVSGGSTKWEAVESAIVAFANDPTSAGLLVGMQFFPAGSTAGANCFSNADCTGGQVCVGAFLIIPGKCGADECSAASYASPKLPMSALPGAAGAVASAFANQGPTGDTPTVPALSGAVQYAKTWGQANPKNKVAIVLATDGDPGDLCAPPSTVQGVTNVATAAYNGPPSIPTFVIGVGSSLTALNQIAKAGSGGTTNAFLVDTNGNAVQQLIAALQAIQGKLLGCDYAPPTPGGGGTPDWSKVNVAVTLGGTSSVLKNVAGAAACDPMTGGWYYDDPLNPTKITLCPSTCTPVQADANAQVDIQLGCPTKQ